MGSGRFDNVSYTSARNTRASKGEDDFQYSKTSTIGTGVHSNLNPRRIKTKPFKKLESRDSAEHPKSNAVFVSIDVTGSNISRAQEVQKKLPNLMEMLQSYLSDPQLLIAANDDFNVEGRRSIQISDFESDNRIDDHIRNILLTSNGGGNDGESYDLILLAAAHMTVLDCLEKRGRKGYFFMYADEPIFSHVKADEVREIFDIDTEGRLPVSAVIEKLKEQYHVFVIWPMGGYRHAREQYEHLFGKECVVQLQQPILFCELIGSLIGITEKKLKPTNVVKDLVKVGTSSNDADEVLNAITPYLKHREATGA